MNPRGCLKSQIHFSIEKRTVITIQNIVLFTDAIRLKNAGQVLVTVTLVKVI